MMASMAFALALMTSPGCLLKDVSQTWYVDGNGAVTWVVQEHDVRSDAQSPIDRRNEESEYSILVQQQRHPMATGLRELGGDKVRTVVLRNEAPFDIRTEARFTGLDEVGRRLIAAIGGTGTSIVAREQGRWEWTMVVRDPSSLGGSFEPAAGITDVLDGLDGLKVVLTSGRFESAKGFTLSKDGRVASPDHDAPEGKSDEPAITLKLVWKTG